MGYECSCFLRIKWVMNVEIKLDNETSNKVLPSKLWMGK